MTARFRPGRFWAVVVAYLIVDMAAAVGIVAALRPAGPVWGPILIVAASLTFGVATGYLALPLMFRAGGGRLDRGWFRRGLAAVVVRGKP